MRTYYIPRNLKGEGRILTIFSYKSLIYTAAGVFIGLPVFLIIRAITGKFLVSAIFPILLGLIGYVISTFKVPQIKGIKIFKDVGGEAINDIIVRYIRFYYNINLFGLMNFKRKRKIYVYTKEEK